MRSAVAVSRSEAPAEHRPDPIDVDDVPFATLEPLIELPSQHDSARRLALTGEKRLMAAVLADAIQIHLKHRCSRSASSQILFRETDRWIESTGRRWPLSFENVCETLNIDGARLRQALRTAGAASVRPAFTFDAGRVRVARGRRIRV